MALESKIASAPQAQKRPKPITQHGEKRFDDYAWLKDENWQAVMQDPSTLLNDIRHHLALENTYTQNVMAPCLALRDEIFEEMKGRQEPEDSSVPVIDGAYAYGHAYRTGDQYGVYKQFAVDTKTRKISETSIDILDADAIAKSAYLLQLAKQKDKENPDEGQSGGPNEAQNTPKKYFDLGSVAHSPCHKWLAYSLDLNGSESYEIFVKPMDSSAHSLNEAKPRASMITKSTGSVEWAADSKTIFWVERDENQRPDSVYCQNIFDPQSQAKCIYKENDPGFFVSISESETGQFLEISAHNHTTSEIHLVPRNAPLTPPQCVTSRQDGIEYSVHEHGSDFYILTNAHGATEFQIMKCPQNVTHFENWSPYIAQTPGVLILAIETYAHFLVRLIRENALPKIIIRDMRTSEEHEISMPESAYALGLRGGYEYDTPWLRISYSSPTTPTQIFDYNMETRSRVLLKTQSIPSGHSPEHYQTERISITARDGAEIPVTLLYRKGLTRDGKAPLLLYGYGSYGITISASFRTAPLSLIDRGFVYAIAHIRGSEAKGHQWYLDGKLDKKPNTFHDFIDVGQGLCTLNYTQRGRIIAQGGSAGGMLVGAALNLDPELFGGVIAAVPFVDVLNTMSDSSLPLTPPEWPEWGNPLEDLTAYTLIKSYSPYDNVVKREYPPVLITAGLTDPRVTYWEPAKWAVKLRDHQTGPAPILLKTNMDAGHQGESGRYDSLKELAFEYAFAVTIGKG